MRAWFTVLFALVGCAPVPPVSTPAPPRRSGGALVLNLHPKNTPPIVGAYDFELLDEVSGSECAGAYGAEAYWVGLNDLEAMSSDRATRQAIAAAAHAAISGLDGADTMVITRVVTKGRDRNRVCATVFGRGVRLVKAVAPGHRAPNADERNEPDNSDDSEQGSAAQ